MKRDGSESGGGASKDCVRRLQKELRKVVQASERVSPEERMMDARPLSANNLLVWHYWIRGAADTPYHNGIYMGKLVFPPNYPFAPPSIFMITPSGRFATNTRLCLSMSDFHPETWSPMWSTTTLLQGIVSFMSEDAITHGSVSASPRRRQELARASWSTNAEDPVFKRLFPDMATYLQIHPHPNPVPLAAQTDECAPRSSEPVSLVDQFLIAGVIAAVGSLLALLLLH